LAVSGQIFGAGGFLVPEILEAAIRSAFGFVSLLVLTRLTGKQQISHLTFHEFIAGITIGGITADLAGGIDVSVWPIFAALVTFVALTILSGYLSLQSRPVRKLLQGEPTVVVHNGKILEGNMARMRYNFDDLMGQLRNKNVFNISDVEYAILETNGELSVLLKTQNQPLTPKDLHIPTGYQGVPSELIMDGEIIRQNLEQNKLSEEWLMEQLKLQGIDNPGEVAYASLDSGGNLYIDRKADNLDHVTDISDREK
jgi:uncharacterized membrane protein YcaP (DUF421 family)